MSEVEITTGVTFATIAREWRCKWDEENDKKSLAACQTAFEAVLPKIKAVDGVENVQRLVCGECHDFKVLIGVKHDKFGGFMDADNGEKDFLEAVGKIPDVKRIETQTITLKSF